MRSLLCMCFHMPGPWPQRTQFKGYGELGIIGCCCTPGSPPFPICCRMRTDIPVTSSVSSTVPTSLPSPVYILQLEMVDRLRLTSAMVSGGPNTVSTLRATNRGTSAAAALASFNEQH